MHAHHHTHASRHKGRLQAVLALTVAFLAVELAFALYTGSLSLLADAVHLLADVGGVLLSLVAIWFADPDFIAVERTALAKPWVARLRERMPVYSWTIATAEQRSQAQVHADALIWEADGRPRN